ncbi:MULTISPECIES: winged helix-turn-helix domain-containing protein [unclassified Microcoleus]|uniref:winged helix-turn-helix domain-containing protein n=1 Tax=unclassified Microcoleus TaxID=2642155 RepID=UPI00403F04D3
MYAHRPVSVQRCWDYLRLLELRLRVPRPEHELSNPDVQASWKKNSANECNKFNLSIHWQQ